MGIDRSILRPLVQAAAEAVRMSRDRVPLARVSSHVALPETTSTGLRALHEFVSTHPALRIFNGGYFYGPDGARRVEAPLLMGALIDAANDDTLERALDELDQYLDASALPYTHRTLVAGLTSSRPIELLPGIQFSPWGNEHSQDPVALELAEGMSWVPGLVPIGGTLDAPFSWPKMHLAAHAPSDLPPPRLPKADGILTCLQVIGHGGVYPLASWYAAPPWCLVGGGARAMHVPPQQCETVELTEQTADALRQYVLGYRALAPSVREALELAVRRLNQARGQWSLVEKAIDLRIAFEMMFSIGEQRDEKSHQELRFRLALRAARWLGADADERKAIFATARRLYDIGSAAVHSGTLSPDWKEPDVDLNGGAVLVRRAAATILLAGPPNWTAVSIG